VWRLRELLASDEQVIDGKREAAMRLAGLAYLSCTALSFCVRHGCSPNTNRRRKLSSAPPLQPLKQVPL